MAKPVEEVRKDKLDTVSELKSKFDVSQSVIMVDYRGLTVAEISDLRKRLREQSIEMKVAKNRLAKIAMEQSGLDTMDTVLKGPTGFVFGIKDAVPPAKVLVKYSEENNKLQIKGGILERKPIGVDIVKQLSKLSSKEEMLSRMLGSLQSPITKVALGLNAAMSSVVYAVKAVADSKSENQ